MNKSRGLRGEPTIDELLSDPITQLIMRYDGIDETVVLGVMAQARKRMRVAVAAA